jgi:pimeloyl-ACP methyl ester carboxylesterase
MSFLAANASLTLLAEIVRFTSSGISLEGEILVPPSASENSRAPAAVIVSGTPDDARADFATLAQGLAERGIAVLTYDVRGTGKSVGDARGARFEQLAADAVAAHTALRARKEIDTTRVALIAFGASGWPAVLADSMSANVSSLVRIGTAEVPPEANSRWKLVRDMGAQKFKPETIRAFAALHPRLLEYIVKRGDRKAILAAIDSTMSTSDEKQAYRKGHLREWIDWAKDKKLPPIQSMRVDPWIRCYAFDPNPLSCASRTPTLLAYGQADSSVLVEESANRMRDSFDFCEGATGEVWIVPGADERLSVIPNSPGDRKRVMPAETLDRIAEWVRRHRIAGP